MRFRGRNRPPHKVQAPVSSDDMSHVPRDIHGRIERAIVSAHSGLLNSLPRALKSLRRKREAFPGDHMSVRKTIEWRVIKQLSSLARARIKARMTEAQISAHDEILEELIPLLPELNRFGFRIPPVVLAGIPDPAPAEKGRPRTYYVDHVRAIDSRERIGEILAENAFKAFGELRKYERAVREKGFDRRERIVLFLSSPALETTRERSQQAKPR